EDGIRDATVTGVQTCLFRSYVRIDTQADEKATTYPSSRGQLELGRLLVQELHGMGLADAEVDKHGIVLATIPATNRGDHSPRLRSEERRVGKECSTRGARCG